MGWGSAGDIVEPMIRFGIAAIEGEELEEETAERMLVPVIKKLQEADWDTEDETLEEFSRHAWVVRAFAECGVREHVDLGDHRERHAFIMRLLDTAGESMTKVQLATYISTELGEVLGQ